MRRRTWYSPTLEALETRWLPSTIIHRGLTPMLEKASVPVVNSPTLKPFLKPPPPGTGTTTWNPQGGSTDGTLATNWTAGLPNNTNAGAFDPNWSNRNCTLGAITCKGFVMDSGYAGTVTFGSAAALGGLVDDSSAGWFYFGAPVTATSLDVAAGASFTGPSTFTLNFFGTGTIAVPAGQTFSMNCADFIINGTASASGSIYLGNGNNGTSFMSIVGTLNLTDNGSFDGSGSSNVRVGDSIIGEGTLALAANKTWTSAVSVYLRSSDGGNDVFSIGQNATFDFSNTTISYNGFNSVCLAEDNSSGIALNYVVLNAGATLNLFDSAVLNSTVEALFTPEIAIDTIGTHAGAAATMVMNGADASLDLTTSGFYGRLIQNANVTWNAGTFYTNIAYAGMGGVWYLDSWYFGTNNTFFIAGSPTYAFQIRVAGQNLPNPYAVSIPFISIPYGATGSTGNWNYVVNNNGNGNGNGWTVNTTGILGVYGFQLRHP